VRSRYTTSTVNPTSRLWRAARTLRRLPERRLHAFRRRRALAQLRAGPLPQRVLVLCYGNICRSPYAAALLEQELGRSKQTAISVESAGFAGWGRPCPPMALEVAAAHGLDLSNHGSRPIALPAASVSDLIIVMDRPQASAVRRIFGPAHRHVLMLGDLDPEPIDTREIQDPFDQPKEAYELCYARLNRCVHQLVDALAESVDRTSPRAPAPQRRPVNTT